MYLLVNHNLPSAGSGHHLTNLFILIIYCFINNYKLILPFFKLDRIHNNNIEIVSNFSEYLNFNELTINNNKFEVLLDKKNLNESDIKILNIKNCKNGILIHDKFIMEQINNKFNNIKINPDYMLNCLINYIKLNKNNDSLNVFLPYKNHIIEKGDYIVNKLKPYQCIHIRRGDLISRINDNDLINRIIKLLKCNDIKNVYIMTNLLSETKNIEYYKWRKQLGCSDKKNKSLINDNLNFLNDIKANNNLNLYLDFKELNDISLKDNYLLYFIENYIMFKANIRISNSEIINKKHYYNFFIYNKNEWKNGYS